MAMRSQRAMAVLWASLALPCALCPEAVLCVCVPAAARAPLGQRGTERLLARCFGVQALLCALLLRCSSLGTGGFAALGAAVAPLLAFDLVAWRGAHLTPAAALADAAGNAVLVALCAAGYYAGA